MQSVKHQCSFFLLQTAYLIDDLIQRVFKYSVNICCWQVQQIAELKSQCLGERLKAIDRGIDLAAFNLADIGGMEVGALCQPFL